jgi:hypothetical protein
MAKLLSRYKGFVAEDVLESILELAQRLSGRSVLHVHTGRLRPDVLSSLARLGDYLEDLGIQHRETTIVGTEDTFDMVSQTEEVSSDGMLARRMRHYETAMRENARKTFLSSDLVMVHGLQPLGLIADRHDDCPWLWRCYANLAGVKPPLSSVLQRYLPKYQGAIFSHARFIPEVKSPRYVIAPAIDLFSPVNESLGSAEVGRVLTRMEIPADRPLALQFLGTNCASESLDAIRVWKSGRIPENAVLVLVRIEEGPECVQLPELEAIRGLERNVRVLQISRGSTRELCALGWAAQVVIESTNSRWPRMDLLEVMWKGAAALVSCGSGTAPFVRSGCGYCFTSQDELSRRLGELLEHSPTSKEMGACAHLSVARHHILPRHLLDYLKLMDHFVRSDSRA